MNVFEREFWEGLLPPPPGGSTVYTDCIWKKPYIQYTGVILFEQIYLIIEGLKGTVARDFWGLFDTYDKGKLKYWMLLIPKLLKDLYAYI